MACDPPGIQNFRRLPFHSIQIHAAKQPCDSPHLPPLRRKSIDQRQPVKTLPESPREIIDPALAAQVAPLPDLLHCHAQNQDVMHQRRAVGAKFALGAVEPQHGPALTFRDRLPRLPAVDIFPRGIDGPRTALGLLPVVLKRPPALVFRLLHLSIAIPPPPPTATALAP